MHPSLPLLRRSLLLALAGAGLQACGTSAPAEDGKRQASGPPSPARPRPAPGPSLADTGSAHYRFARFDLDSADGRRHHRVQLAIPRSAPPAQGHPLLVLLDGNAAFALLTEQMLAQQAASGRPLAIAALGYDTERSPDTTARAFDYTPPVPGEQPTWDDAARQRPGGGADLFLDLLEQQLLPAIGQRVPTDAAHRTLWGHSYGGLLALYTLFTRPQLFSRYAAADPSLWWHDGFLLSVEARAQPLPAGRRTQLLLMAGGAGTATRSERPGMGPGMQEQARNRRAMLSDATPRMAERQALRAGLDLRWQTFPGVGHGPMRPASIPPTLAFASAA